MPTIESLTCGCQVDIDAGLKVFFCATHNPYVSGGDTPDPDPPRDFFHEALRILTGTTMLLPQREHLEALAREGRSGTCVCGAPLAQHFDAKNRFKPCGTLRGRT